MRLNAEVGIDVWPCRAVGADGGEAVESRDLRLKEIWRECGCPLPAMTDGGKGRKVGGRSSCILYSTVSLTFLSEMVLWGLLLPSTVVFAASPRGHDSRV